MRIAARDRWARVHGTTPLRAWNWMRLAMSYAQAKRTGKPFMPRRAMPSSLSIEPTTSCNLRCPECPSGLRSFTRPTGMLETSRAVDWIMHLAPWLTYVNLYFQGEPMLNPNLEKLIEACSSHRIYSSTSTNAHHLTEDRCRSLIDAGLSRLIISIDGMSEVTYSSYRVGGSLAQVLEGTRRMLEAKKALRRGPHVVWQFLVVGTNEQDIPELLKRAREIGVDEVHVKTAQLDDPRDGHPLLTEAPELRRYDRHPVTGAWTLRNSMDNACWRMWQGAVVTWDGRVVPCCFDKDAQHVMGMLTQENMKTIWHNPNYASFRTQLFKQRDAIPMCTNCSEGSHVYA